MNLFEQLQATAQKNYKDQLTEAHQILDSVKENLSMQDSADNEMIKYFGTERVVKEQKERVVSVTKLVEEEFITYKDIKKICLSYHMRFLQTTYYKKAIPLQALNDLRNFKEQNRIGDRDLKDNLYIIAPADHFSLGKRPKQDPILIYKKQDYYKIVSKWGSNFSATRRFLGFLHESPNGILFLSIFIIANLLFTILTIQKASNGLWFITNIIICMVFAAVMSENEITPSEEYWDAPYRK